MTQKVLILKVNQKRFPLVKKMFPDVKYMSFDGFKFRTLKDAKDKIKKQFKRKKIAMPEFVIVES